MEVTVQLSFQSHETLWTALMNSWRDSPALYCSVVCKRGKLDDRRASFKYFPSVGRKANAAKLCTSRAGTIKSAESFKKASKRAAIILIHLLPECVLVFMCSDFLLMYFVSFIKHRNNFPYRWTRVSCVCYVYYCWYVLSNLKTVITVLLHFNWSTICFQVFLHVSVATLPFQRLQVSFQPTARTRNGYNLWHHQTEVPHWRHEEKWRFKHNVFTLTGEEEERNKSWQDVAVVMDQYIVYFPFYILTLAEINTSESASYIPENVDVA